MTQIPETLPQVMETIEEPDAIPDRY